jgi:hypothetical protein
MKLTVLKDAKNDVCEIGLYLRLVRTVFRRRKQQFRPKCFYLEYTGRFKILRTWGGDSKVSVLGEDGLIMCKTCSVWESWSIGQENDLYSLFFRQQRLSTLLKKKNTITPYTWRLFNCPVVCVHEMEATSSSVTLVRLSQTTRLHS